MPRKTATATTPQQPATETTESVTIEPSGGLPSHGPETPDHAADAGQYSHLPDPRALMTVSLGKHTHSPKIELLRSHRFNQLQLRSGEPLNDTHKEMLGQAGWTDRTEAEGIWTRQLPRHGEKWRAAADAERLFAQIAGEMRADRKLPPVSVGMSAA